VDENSGARGDAGWGHFFAVFEGQADGGGAYGFKDLAQQPSFRPGKTAEVVSYG